LEEKERLESDVVTELRLEDNLPDKAAVAPPEIDEMDEMEEDAMPETELKMPAAIVLLDDARAAA